MTETTAGQFRPLTEEERRLRDQAEWWRAIRKNQPATDPPPETSDPHADGYRIDLETDPMRAAAHLLADFIATHQLEGYNKPYTMRALSGDASGLLTDTVVGMKWIRAQLERDPGTVINAWTAQLMQAVGEWPEAPDRPVPEAAGG